MQQIVSEMHGLQQLGHTRCNAEPPDELSDPGNQAVGAEWTRHVPDLYHVTAEVV